MWHATPVSSKTARTLVIHLLRCSRTVLQRYEYRFWSLSEPVQLGMPWYSTFGVLPRDVRFFELPSGLTYDTIDECLPANASLF